MKILRILFSCLLTGVILIFGIKPALAFCGFYVAKADSSLYNQASQVIIARDDDRTVLTMSNDYQGEVKDFAMVVPVPVILQEEQVHVGEAKILQRLDDFSAPRLVEYFDEDPCNPVLFQEDLTFQSVPRASSPTKNKVEADLGVTVEEQFSIGEYDIVILSAKESDGLETWLIQNDYKIPKGARKLLQPYIKQNLKFFVAKVNLEEFNSNGFEKLRPISMAFESPKFMLPIRLGMMNANGDQDLIVYLLSPKVLNQEELKEAGVFWLDRQNPNNRWGGSNVFITRLHVRYNRNNFPEDLKFQSTSDRNLFQGRYVIRHPFEGELTCDAGKEYQQSVRDRQEREAKSLASLTGWDIKDIRDRIKFVKAEPIQWWENLWQR